MRQTVDSVRFRKASDINRRYPVFEAVVEGRIVFDISASDDGVVDVALYEGAANMLFALADFRTLIAEGERLLEGEMRLPDR